MRLLEAKRRETMKVRTGFLTTALVVLLVTVISVVMPRRGTDAASNTGTKRYGYSVTAVPTAEVCSSPVPHPAHGEVEVIANTEVLTRNSYTLSVQQSAAQAGPWLTITPTALAGSSTAIISTTDVTALETDANLLYTRACFAETTGLTTETITLDFLLKNTQE
jgi:hypothetical protein